jgi:hypothetical protein
MLMRTDRLTQQVSGHTPGTWSRPTVESGRREIDA